MAEIAIVVVITVLTLGGAYMAQTRHPRNAAPAVELLNRIDFDEIKRRIDSIEKRSWT
jgi:hypothetical protein